MICCWTRHHPARWIPCAVPSSPGEACPKTLVARHHTQRPGARLVNEYGPTEATVWCVAADLHDTEDEVPIGRAIPGVTLTLRDGQGRGVPDGLPGLLHVSGPGVSTGYFNAPLRHG